MQERRLFVDCGRKYFSKDWFIRQIHEMSYMKLNTLDIHFSENLGFRLECDTDPKIVSEEHLTKAEMREILEEARLYGINVIPSIDSPGHVDQILKVHPEYGQVASDGTTHYSRGLDVTNPKAVEYMKSIYKEYIDFFKECGATTDISIGCDEYMEFDHPPFTTQYKSVLEDWAHKNLGPQYSWTDTLATYINDLAEFCQEQGLKPRIFNDGIYYGEGRPYAQKVEIHDWIGIDFWSQMSWNRDIANLQTLVNHDLKDIYNFNANYGYFVLRNNDRGASFDFDDSLERWWNMWRPGDFQDPQNAHVLSDDDPRIKGTAIAIWCDYPEVATEDQVTEGIAKEMRAMASRSWNVDCNKTMDLEAFKALSDKLGHAPAWEKGERLPDSGEILPSEDVGKVTVHYVDVQGKALQEDAVLYGTIGKQYTVKAPEIYGYRLVGDASSYEGTYTKEGVEYTFVYELHTNKTDLGRALAAAPIADASIAETYGGVADAFKTARTVFEDSTATQKQVDEALAALNKEVGKVVGLNQYALYVECTYPLAESDYVGGYAAYADAVAAGKKLLGRADASDAELTAALQAIRDAKGGLTKPTGDKPEITATDDFYSMDGGYPYGNMIDGNPNTKCWFNKNQEPGKEIVFTFPAPLSMSSVKVEQPEDARKGDFLKSAEVQVSADASGDTWTTVGTIAGADDLVKTIDFEARPVRRVRILLKDGKPNWYQISEVTFAAKPMEEDAALSDAIASAEDLSVSGKSAAAVQRLVAALIDAQKALVAGSDEGNSALTALKASVEALVADDGVDVDLADLQAFYDSVKGLKESDYTAESWKPFAAALDAAADVLHAGKADQGASNDALTALQRTYFELVSSASDVPSEVNKDELKAVVAAYEAEDLKESDWTPDTWGAYSKALDRARAVLADAKATQADVDRALAELRAAHDGLKPADGKPTDPNQKPGQNPGQNNSGQGSGAAGKPGKPAGGLPQTGDPSALVAIAGASGSLAAAIGAWMRRRR